MEQHEEDFSLTYFSNELIIQNIYKNYKLTNETSTEQISAKHASQPQSMP